MGKHSLVAAAAARRPVVDLLAKMLGPFLKKAEELEARADKLETKISALHQRSSAFRDAATKLRALAGSP